MVRSTRRLSRSISVTVRSSWSATQTEPSPSRMSVGLEPTGTRATTLFVSGLMTATSLECASATSASGSVCRRAGAASVESQHRCQGESQGDARLQGAAHRGVAAAGAASTR